jgi:hypothetical protein
MPSRFQIAAGDHDFHVVNLTPSVTLLTEIKAHLGGNGELPSFYKGTRVLIYYRYIILLLMMRG